GYLPGLLGRRGGAQVDHADRAHHRLVAGQVRGPDHLLAGAGLHRGLEVGTEDSQRAVRVQGGGHPLVAVVGAVQREAGRVELGDGERRRIELARGDVLPAAELGGEVGGLGGRVAGRQAQRVAGVDRLARLAEVLISRKPAPADDHDGQRGEDGDEPAAWLAGLFAAGRRAVGRAQLGFVPVVPAVAGDRRVGIAFGIPVRLRGAGRRVTARRIAAQRPLCAAAGTEGRLRPRARKSLLRAAGIPQGVPGPRAPALVIHDTRLAFSPVPLRDSGNFVPREASKKPPRGLRLVPEGGPARAVYWGNSFALAS